jgi:hypothetical protein
VLILIPLIMAAINSDWLYTPIGYLDPWYNVGYFLHYGDPSFRTSYYKISRLSWLLPGWVLYHVFRATVANFVLHVGALLVATIFVYLTLARLVARDIAFLAAIFLTVYYPFHGSGGWDYQTTGAGACYAPTLYFLTRAAQSQTPAISLFAGGAAFAAAFHADILFINMAPVLAGHYLFANRRTGQPLRRLLHAVGPALAGFVVLTLVLCAISWSAGGSFLFFQPMLDLAFNFVRNPDEQRAWWSPWSSGWFAQRSTYYLDLPLATFLVGAWMLLSNRRHIWRDAVDPVPAFLIGQYLIVGTIWMIWQSLGETALQPDYFAYPLIIPCILGLAGIMSLGRADVQSATQRYLVPASLLLAFVAGADVLDHLRRDLTIPELQGFFARLLDFPVALLLTLLMVRARYAPLAVIATIMLFQAINPPFARVRETYSFDERCHVSRTAFAAMIAFDRFLSQLTRPERVWMWMGPPQIAGNATACRFDLLNFRGSTIALSLNALGGADDISAKDIPDAQITALKPGDWVAIATTDRSQGEDVRKRLSEMHRSVGAALELEVSVARIPVFLQLLPVDAAPAIQP